MSQRDVTRRLEILEHAQRRMVLQPMIDKLSAATGVSGDELWGEASRWLKSVQRTELRHRPE